MVDAHLPLVPEFHYIESFYWSETGCLLLLVSKPVPCFGTFTMFLVFCSLPLKSWDFYGLLSNISKSHCNFIISKALIIQ